MRKLIPGVATLLTTVFLFTACNKEETYTVPAQEEIQKINGTWLTIAGGLDLNNNSTPDPGELTQIDTSVQKVFTHFRGDGKAIAWGSFMGSDLDTTIGTWLITPDKYLHTTSPDLGAKKYLIYQLTDSMMMLKDVETQPNRWISYTRDWPE